MQPCNVTGMTNAEQDNGPERCGRMHGSLISIRAFAAAAAEHMIDVDTLRRSLREVATLADHAIKDDERMRGQAALMAHAGGGRG
jgi:hypothetical protein